ncbi:MAG: hypothetical protein CMK07_00655 [Ponticaulis sp.]|nr:hypothetical protein [Ponticaulis sp.]
MMKKLIASTLTGLMLTGAAQAHNVFEVNEAKAGSMMIAKLGIMHGCDGSPTTKIVVDMPDGLNRVRPADISGWDVEITMKTLEEPFMLRGFEMWEVVDTVTWSGGSVPDFGYKQFDLWMEIPDLPGTRLDFPVHQYCEEGELHWDDTAPQGADDPFSVPEPAPFIYVTAAE